MVLEAEPAGAHLPAQLALVQLRLEPGHVELFVAAHRDPVLRETLLVRNNGDVLSCFQLKIAGRECLFD